MRYVPATIMVMDPGLWNRLTARAETAIGSLPAMFGMEVRVCNAIPPNKVLLAGRDRYGHEQIVGVIDLEESSGGVQEAATNGGAEDGMDLGVVQDDGGT